MELLIDNTGLHAAGRCLRGIGKSDTDLDGLLQLASQLVLADHVYVSTFETVGVQAVAQEVRNSLIDLGLTDVPLEFLSMETEKFKQCCLSAADRLAADLAFCLDADSEVESDLEIAVPDLRGADAQTFGDVHIALTEGLTDSQRQDILQRAFGERENPAQIFMLAGSQQLWERGRALAAKKDWAMPDTYRFIVHLRYYLNLETARAHRSLYCPAVSRGRLLKRRSAYLLSRLEALVAEAAADLGGAPLHYPSIVEALVRRSKGEHHGLIAEVQRARTLAAPLREYLRGQADDSSDAAGQVASLRDMNEMIINLRQLLRKDLGLDARPRARDAFELQFFGLVPLPSFVKLADWATFARTRKRVNILSEFALALSCSDLDPYSVGRLRESSLVG